MPYHLKQPLDVERPDAAWVTDLLYIQTNEGWLFLAVALDLLSGQVIGWSMQSRMTADLAMQALLMAVWRGQPKFIVRSDQGSQFTGYEWQDFLKAHGWVPSMSGRGTALTTR